MFFVRLLLYPFSILYGGLTRIRNYLFDTGYSRSISFEVFLVSVGNLIAGGAGKTPLVEYLVKLLKENYRTASLSRGYGRKSKGFRIANDNDTSRTIGDEPLQLYRKFSKDIKVAVGEERAIAIPLLLHEHENLDVIVLDDAFQHRHVKPALNILVTAYDRPFFTDYVLPFGMLREGRKGALRADIVVVSKCPSGLTSEVMEDFSAKIKRYSKPDVKIFFSSIVYEVPKKVFGEDVDLQKNIVLLTGIANAYPLKSYLLDEGYQIVRHFEFLDHYTYTKGDIEKIKSFLNGFNHPLTIITTEKDAVRLSEPSLKDSLAGLCIFSVPIEMQFIRDGAIFDKLLLDAIESFYKSPETT